jgi:hypothetical protein
MGAKVGSFVKDVAKAGLKGATSYVLGTYIPYVGSHIANYINSKYAKGGVLMEVGGTPPDLPDGFKPKEINSPAQLKDLVKKFPEEAKKAGLSIDLINQEVKDAKVQMKAIGGMIKHVGFKSEIPPRFEAKPVKEPKVEKKMATGGKLSKEMLLDTHHTGEGGHEMGKRPVFAVGGEPKPKKARSQAQIDATKRLVEANRKRREKK